VQSGSDNENNSYFSPAITLSYSHEDMCGKPQNLNLCQAKVLPVMQCMDLVLRVQGLQLHPLDLRHKKSSQFQGVHMKRVEYFGQNKKR
jgi:hypothetical protein